LLNKLSDPLSISTICQPGNTKSYFSPSLNKPWGLVSLDWSIANGEWQGKSNRQSTCEATSVKGCQLLKAQGTATRCFIYHNTALALEWLESQRAVMYDPSKADYFLQYTDGLGHKNGTIYNEPISFGDQYFWDFTNPDAANYYVTSILTSISDPAVDGTFTDDVSGVPEEHPDVMKNIKMTAKQLANLQLATQATHQYLLDNLVVSGKYNWQGFGAGDAVVKGPNKNNCLAFMRNYCQPAFQGYPLAMQYDTSNKNQSIAAFLIVRPPHGWLGWGWESGGDQQFDPMFLLNVGEPTGLCVEKPNAPGVFSRDWTKGTPVLDCNTWSAKLPF